LTESYSIKSKTKEINAMDENINKEFGYLIIKERVNDYITPKGVAHEKIFMQMQ